MKKQNREKYEMEEIAVLRKQKIRDRKKRPKMKVDGAGVKRLGELLKNNSLKN